MKEAEVLWPWKTLLVLLAVAGLLSDRGTTRVAVAASPVSGPREDLVETALRGPLAHAEEIVFAVRSMGGDGHWYANFGHRSTSWNQMQYGPDGGRLCRLNLRTGAETVLVDDPQGSVRDPHLHYDGTKILFSYRPGGSRYYHLYEINVDGSGLRQITDGPFDDIEPIYLPEGDILFCSSRCNRWVQCWFTQVAVLYRCAADGAGIHPVSCNIEQDNTPWMMPDGRVLYMRWEYVDRSRVRFHHLWTANPDGTGAMIYYGNMHGGTVMLDAKPIPGSHKVVSIFSPGHGRKEHAGQIAVVDVGNGPDDRSMARFVDPGNNNYRDPYPLSEDLFLVAEDNRLLLIASDGHTQEIYRTQQPSMMLHEPRPVRSRPREPVIPSRSDQDTPRGRLILSDVNRGRNMEGVKPGEIKKLLVLETLPKPVNFSGTMEPISLGGTFTLPRILGTVPVEPDGSAFLEVPALRPLFFVALDENGRSVKRMQSFTSVMPNETTSCVGCHEHRTNAPPTTANPLALRRRPSKIEPLADMPDVFDFPRDIQPILDAHCVECHNYEKRPAADLPLVSDHGPWYSHSYAALMTRGQISHGNDADGNRAPRAIGSSASRLLRLLDEGHEDVILSAAEKQKLCLWIDSGAPYAGTYASLGTGMVNVRVNAQILQRRCTACHDSRGEGTKLTLRWKYHDEVLYNLSRPPQSPLLLAPLSQQAGGWGLCVKPAGGPTAEAVFQSVDDPDYRELLASIQSGQAELDRIKRFDMPGFRPNQHYVREMKRYGILPEDFDLDSDSIDSYQVDRAYWRSFWIEPSSSH